MSAERIQSTAQLSSAISLSRLFLLDFHHRLFPPLSLEILGRHFSVHSHITIGEDASSLEFSLLHISPILLSLFLYFSCHSKAVHIIKVLHAFTCFTVFFFFLHLWVNLCTIDFHHHYHHHHFPCAFVLQKRPSENLLRYITSAIITPTEQE